MVHHPLLNTRDDDHQILSSSSSSSAFSASSESSSLISGLSTSQSLDKSIQTNRLSLQQNLQKPLLYSPSSSLDTPAIPPRAPGRVASINSIRLLDREKRISNNLHPLENSSLHQQHLQSSSLKNTPSPASSTINSPVYSCNSSNTQLPLDPSISSFSNRKTINISRSTSLSTHVSSEIINPISPLYHNNSASNTLNSSKSHKSFKSLDSPPIPPARTQNRLSVFKLQQLRLQSLDPSLSHESLASTTEKLPRWISSIMIFQNDPSALDPDLKIMQPCVNFSDDDFRIISFSALPDKNSFNPLLNSNPSLFPQLKTYSQFHSFRFQPSISSQIPGFSHSSSQKELFGFSLYTCRPHPFISNEFLSESIVILSHLNYPQLFNACLQLIYDVTQQNSLSTPSSSNVQLSQIVSSSSSNSTIATQLQPPLPLSASSKSLEKDVLNDRLVQNLPVLQSALKNISQWPDPIPNSTLELGFLGTVINVSIPHHESVPLLGTVELDTSSASFHSNGRNFHKINSISNPSSIDTEINYKNTFSYSTSSTALLKNSLSPAQLIPNDAPVITASEPAGTWDSAINYISDLNDLYLLYEYVLLGKPLVIYANSPHMCSTFISLLIDLIRPIPYGGRVREYVTADSLTCLNTSMGESIKDFEVGGITGVTDPELVHRIRAGCSPNVLIFALSPNKNLIAAQKQAYKLIKALDPASLSSLTTSNAKNTETRPAGKIVFDNISAALPPITSPYFYYRTFHNGVGILRRQNNSWSGFAYFVMYQLPSRKSSDLTKNDNLSKPDSSPFKKSEDSTFKPKASPRPNSAGHSRNSSHSSNSSSGVFSKLFSKFGLSRKVTEPPKSRPLSTPNAAYVSSNTSYRTVPKPATNVHSTIHKNSRPISTPIVTMLEPASKPDSKNTDTSLLPNPKIDNALPTGEISSEVLGEIQDSIKQISKSRMLVPDSKFMEQITQMSFSSLQLAIPKSIEYISKLANLYDSPSLPASSLKSLLKTENLPFDSLAMPKNLDVAIRFHFATLTSRFLSPLSCYLDPLSGSESATKQIGMSEPGSHSLGSMKKNVLDIVSNMANIQRKSGLIDSKRLEKRNSFRKSIEGTGTLKQHPAMVTSESMYSLTLPAVKGSSHRVLQSTPEYPSSTSHHSLTSKLNRSNSKKSKLGVTSNNSLSRSSRDNKSPKPLSRSNSTKVTSTTSKDNSVNVSGNASGSHAKRYSLPPTLTLPFEKEPAAGEESPMIDCVEEDESEFFKEFASFTIFDGSTSLNATAGASVTQSPSDIQTAPVPQYQSLLLSGSNDEKSKSNHSLPTKYAVETFGTHYASDSFSPNTPTQIFTMSTTSLTSSYNPGNESLISPITPATPPTPGTPCSTHSSRKSHSEFSANTHTAAPSLLRNLSSNQHHPASISSNISYTENHTKKGKSVTFGQRSSLDAATNTADETSAQSTPSMVTPSSVSTSTLTASKNEGRTMSLGLNIPRSNFSKFEDNQKLSSSNSFNGSTVSPSLASISSKLGDSSNTSKESERTNSLIFESLCVTDSNSHSNSNNNSLGNDSSDFRKQDIYKEFMNNMNFANWLKMNHVDVL